jgi:hypothetical protein
MNIFILFYFIDFNFNFIFSSKHFLTKLLYLFILFYAVLNRVFIDKVYRVDAFLQSFTALLEFSEVGHFSHRVDR